MRFLYFSPVQLYSMNIFKFNIFLFLSKSQLFNQFNRDLCVSCCSYILLILLFYPQNTCAAYVCVLYLNFPFLTPHYPSQFLSVFLCLVYVQSEQGLLPVAFSVNARPTSLCSLCLIRENNLTPPQHNATAHQTWFCGGKCLSFP